MKGLMIKFYKNGVIRILLILITIIPITGFSQVPYVIQWKKTYGGTGDDGLRSVIPTSDGCYLLYGDTGSRDGDVKSGIKGGVDFWIVKVNDKGDIIWERTFGGSENDFIQVVQHTSDGGFLLGGVTYSINGDVGPNPKGCGWLLKIDINGIIQWGKTYNEVGASYGIRTIEPTSDNGFLIGGDDYDLDICKIDNSGNVLWTKKYGGSQYESICLIKSTSDNGFLLGGITKSNDGDVKSGNHGGNDIWVVKINNAGNILWEKTYGGIDSDQLNTIQLTTDGGYLLGGDTYSKDGDVKSLTHGQLDAWLLKIDGIGNIIWEKTYGGSSDETINTIQPTDDGGYLLGGKTSSNDGDIKSGFKSGYFDSWIIKIDNLGKIQWEKTYGGSGFDVVYRIIPTTNYGYILGGQTSSQDGDVTPRSDTSYSNFWLFKIVVNNPPTDINLSKTNVNENVYKGTIVGSISSIDDVDYDTYTYSLVSGSGDTDNSYFQINGNFLITNSELDFEKKSSYSIRIQTKDSSGNTFSKSFTIIVNDLNESPTDIILSNNKIDENVKIGTEVGWLSTIDQDKDEIFTYSLDSTEYYVEKRFKILNNKLITNSKLDFENTSEYSIVVHTKDKGNNIFSKNILIKVNDLNEVPTDIFISDYKMIDENVKTGTEIGTLSTIDQDFGDKFKYSFVSGLGDEDNGKFYIVENKLLTNSVLDYETKSTYSFRLETTDLGGNTYSKTIQIRINDVNEPPLDIILSNNSVYENSKLLSDVGIVSTIDDVGDTHTYSLVPGEGDTDNSSFIFVGDQLLTRDDFDYEKKSKYSIRIQTKDSQGNVFSKPFVINILNVIETGIGDVSVGFDVNIFPNPITDNRITIETSHSLPVSFSLFDLSGKILIEKELVDNISQISTQNLIGGIYIIQIKDGGKVLTQLKIIKK